MKLAGLIYGLTNGPRGWSAFLHYYYKKIVARTMALVCTTNVSMFSMARRNKVNSNELKLEVVQAYL
ncbi:hypothetical protein, partial [Lysinibacillus fusiformis]|uniref:hypothetical protein n=1 Tax=Lysinibacillus fusiformis TaxID=28031 RepID=UPI0020C06B4F